MDSRTPEDDPHAYCMPMGVPRQAGNYPWRFVQYPTHKKATHIFLLWEGNIHSFRQIFMDAHASSRSRSHLVRPLDRADGKATRS